MPQKCLDVITYCCSESDCCRL